ncbi:glutamyl-tRNA(Gln) amidotransferase subunit E [Methanocaldococcus villosus KIN24-T80]|uniref:Glutamyl-tRNA(Gln) amidotransferase subunit E n=1 Tax=Methanocaldococcus villosus KIN24-T80 TaxID=1069083 RepID=N6VRN4_9EURY|nr:Glu-tRNA(Gln) amidotransferase subunit GatE [Methanocaldococcus villosus]ENN96535.1 glutamyl-tRNA(Gln) amidotransferase subunit E [Methanocaldococcus villosus KIN24-T80]
MDYNEIGLKVGLEIHQQLNTERKLFCHCPTELTNEVKGEVERILRATLSELGEIDRAALLEMRKGKKFIYQYNNSSCLVELDEEPPHMPSEEALKIALQIAMLLNMKTVDVAYVMRKIVIDGSNPSGFQRTIFLAYDGYVETEDGKVRIESLCLEEDAARKVEERGDKVVYNLDRLGIPLVEISTAPDINSPKMARETAKRIGEILRMCKVKRGIGTIRQDINISIKDGARVEIKGVSELYLIEKVVEYEVLRQLNLLKIRDELKERNAEVIEEIYDVTDIFKNCNSKIIKRALKDGKVKAIVLKKFGGLVGKEIQPGRRLGTEFADRAKVIAGVSGIIHTDELPKYGITEEDVKRLREFLKVDEDDAIVLVADKEEKANKALQAVIERAKEALIGVPEETRKANEDGTTSYLRPLPGKARMYPETDIPPIFIKDIEVERPELPEEKIERFKREYMLSDELAKKMVFSYYVDLFEELCKRFKNIKPTLIAKTLEESLKEIKREGYNIENIKKQHLYSLFDALSSGKLAKEGIIEVLKGFCEMPDKDIDEILEIKGLKGLSREEVEKIVEEIINENINIIKEKKDKALGYLMGRCMAKLRGKADGKMVNEILKEKIRNIL